MVSVATSFYQRAANHVFFYPLFNLRNLLYLITYIRPYKVAAGKTAIQTMEERFAYGLNPQKLGAVSSHLCDPATAAAEFPLVKSEYQAATARPV